MTAHRNGRVLVVNDHDPKGTTLASAFADGGYDVREACGGSEALAHLRYWQPQLIVLDLTHPGMDGFAFTAELRRRAVAIRVPVIVLETAGKYRVCGSDLGVAAIVSRRLDATACLATADELLTRSVGAAA